jgi:hypothetical protein
MISINVYNSDYKKLIRDNIYKIEFIQIDTMYNIVANLSIYSESKAYRLIGFNKHKYQCDKYLCLYQ